MARSQQACQAFFSVVSKYVDEEINSELAQKRQNLSHTLRIRHAVPFVVDGSRSTLLN